MNDDQDYESPFPDPDILKQYEAIHKGAADRILRMVEQQMQHRHALERSHNRQTLIGVFYGFIIALVGFGGGLYAATSGQKFWGTVVSLSTLAATVGVFIYGVRVIVREKR